MTRWAFLFCTFCKYQFFNILNCFWIYGFFIRFMFFFANSFEFDVIVSTFHWFFFKLNLVLWNIFFILFFSYKFLKFCIEFSALSLFFLISVFLYLSTNCPTWRQWIHISLVFYLNFFLWTFFLFSATFFLVSCWFLHFLLFF